ncbi:MAG: hypothetical protein ABGX16_04810 [Pirellulales bacterium]
MSPDGLTLIFISNRTGGEGEEDIWEAVRPSLNDPWSVHVLGPNVNSSVDEKNPVMSSDGLTLLFGSGRVGGVGIFDIWMSTRDAIGNEWRPASNLGPTVNTANAEIPSQLWGPGNLLLFESWGLPGFGVADMFYVSVVPDLPGDFNLNGIVDGTDFLKWQRNPSIGLLTDWETNYGTVATLSVSTTVPEPSGAALALAALCLAMSRRRI